MRLAGAVAQGSGEVNEDGYGIVTEDGEVTAAWVFDGVTGINDRNYLPAATDAQWFVDKAHGHLLQLAGLHKPLDVILAELVERLIDDWKQVSSALALPEDYDHPAACLTLAKRYDTGWQALRLGDSLIVSKAGQIRLHPVPPSNLSGLEEMLKHEARKRRDAGTLDFKALLKEFHPDLMASRRAKNTPEGLGILVAGHDALHKPEYIDLGAPEAILLCTDGFYRAVDHYGLYGDAELLAECVADGGVDRVLSAIRATERSDPHCQTYLRFKPADDATAVVLARYSTMMT